MMKLIIFTQMMMTDKIRFKKGYKYLLVDEVKFETTINRYYNNSTDTPNFDAEYFSINYETGIVIVKKRYAWDGISFALLDKLVTIRASLFHDVLYQAIRLGYLKESYKIEADKLLRQTLNQDGGNTLLSQVCYVGVRLFGKVYLTPDAEPKILIFPENKT